MVETLTGRQRDVLDVISRAVEQTGQEPTLTAIGEELGGITPPSVFKHIQALEKKGFLRRHPNRRPPIELLHPLAESAEGQIPVAVPLVGTLRAGQPLRLQDTSDDHVLAPRDLLHSHSDAVAVRVGGFGFFSEGLLDGDIVLLKRGPAAVGATVLALLDGGSATVRRYLPEDGVIRLASVQPAGEDLLLSRLEVVGTVLAAMRRYPPP